jgi:heterodisulfide reductase subunit A
MKQPERKIGVYICHCGGNISDHVEVEKVRAAVEKEFGVTVAKTSLFTCSDASQQEMIKDIREQKLDGMVVASCSPKLHLMTFRNAAKRAGLNPFQYVQVNIREQCSWPHSDDKEGATRKAIGLVRGGVGKALLQEPLEPIRLTSVKKVLVIGAGITGLRAALALADLDVEVFIIEKEGAAGGMVGTLGVMYPSGKKGSETMATLLQQVKKKSNITLFLNAQLIEKSGHIGNFDVQIEVKIPGIPGALQKTESIPINAGAIIVASGFANYQPQAGEYGSGLPGVLTLSEFERLLQKSDGRLVHQDKEVKRIAFIYCVGSRENPEKENANRYCSRYCCNTAVHLSLLAQEKFTTVKTFHLYRDIRTYGKFELLYEKAGRAGAVFLRFHEQNPPRVRQEANGLEVIVKDLLSNGIEIAVSVDLIVLVTGMVANPNDALNQTLKLPLGSDRFYNEIHAKLRPVETVIDGVYITGSCQGPKNFGESVISALSAVAKAAALLIKGYVDLQPFVAYVMAERCTWCGECERACPYAAIEKIAYGDKEIARVIDALCKGCGACLPVCPKDATQLKGYTDEQMEAMIDAFARETANVR